MTKRFDTTASVGDILGTQYKSSTLRNDKYSDKLLQEFCGLKKFDYHSNSCLSDWDSLLCEFFISAKKSDGLDFTASSLHSLRYAIGRVLKGKIGVDIISHDSFKKSSSVHKAMIRKLKQGGKGYVKHYDVITDDDMKKIAEMPFNTPALLQWRVWLNIMLHFLNRGRENIHNLTKNDIELIQRSDGKRFMKLRDFQTKNHQGDSGARSTEAILMETGGSDCPVSLYELYVSKLHPKNNFLWQKVKDTYLEDDAVWFTNRKLGVNTISTFLPTISSYLKLSQKYTNHCLRATGITILGRKNFQDTEIACFSGHKSISSLSLYKRTAETVKERMSSALHESFSNQSYLPTSVECVLQHTSTEQSTSSSSVENINLPCSSSTLHQTSTEDSILSLQPTFTTQVQEATSVRSMSVSIQTSQHISDTLATVPSRVVGNGMDCHEIFQGMFTNCNISNINITFSKN
jgi:hypothetical protein